MEFLCMIRTVATVSPIATFFHDLQECAEPWLRVKVNLL